MNQLERKLFYLKERYLNGTFKEEKQFAAEIIRPGDGGALRKSSLVQAVEYMISGGAYFWVGYLTFFLLDKGLGWNLFWATMTANVAGWTVNYLLQRYWVFKSNELKNHKTEVTGRYAVITLVDFVLNYFILLGLKNIGITPYIGQFISAAFFTVWNYLWYRFWVFPSKFTSKTKITAPRLVAHRAHGHSAYRT